MSAKLFGAEASQLIRKNLQHLKTGLESGVYPGTKGQPKGGPAANGHSADRIARVGQTTVEHASEASFPASDAPAFNH